MTIASYPGGKSNKKKHKILYQSIPKNIHYLVDLFTGLSNFYLGINKRTKFALLDDLDSEVYSLLLCIKDKELLNKLINQVKKIQPIEKKDYYFWKSFKPTSELEKAIRLLVILNCSPNGAGGGYSNEKAHRHWYTNKIPIWKEICKLFQKTQITNFDYTLILEDIIAGKTKVDLLYLDPPYFKVAENDKLYRNYNSIDLDKFKTYLSKIDSQ